MTSPDSISLADALHTLAFMGDLSMGQPPDHSVRVAWLALRMAEALGVDADQHSAIQQVALLRFVGCTANASDVARVLRDDVRGRAALLAGKIDAVHLLVAPRVAAHRRGALSATHCEVSGIIATTMGLSADVVSALQSIFATFDGNGTSGLGGDAVPLSIYLAHLAGDLDILTREHGLPTAIQLINSRGDAIYPRLLVDRLRHRFDAWLADLESRCPTLDKPLLATTTAEINMTLLADAIDLKLPWLTGHSRAVADLARQLAVRLDTPLSMRRRVYRAALLHGLGRVSVANSVWDKAGALSLADWEQVRLCPYWTSRAAVQIPSLQLEAETASFAFERLDGSGYFRSARDNSMPLEARILQVASAYVALCAPRPWRPALSPAAALEHLQRQAQLGRYDSNVVGALDGRHFIADVQPAHAAISRLLSKRETEVLRLISHGHTNKEAARQLELSPSTIRTHTENIFRKLECKSRAAATLKASVMGLLNL